MSNHPSSFAEWQNYPSTIDPIHVAWLKSAKKTKTAFAVADIVNRVQFRWIVLPFGKRRKIV